MPGGTGSGTAALDVVPVQECSWERLPWGDPWQKQCWGWILLSPAQGPSLSLGAIPSVSWDSFSLEGLARVGLVQEEGWEKHLTSTFPDVRGVTSILPWGVNFGETTELLRLCKAESALGGSCLSMWEELVCVWIMSSALGTGEIHTWCTVPGALPGELPTCSPCTAPALPKHSGWWAVQLGGVLLRSLEEWLWVWPRAVTSLGERRGRTDPKGCVPMTTATSSACSSAAQDGLSQWKPLQYCTWC